MVVDCDRIALIHALTELAGRHISDAEAESVIEHYNQLRPQRANEIWAQNRRAPAVASADVVDRDRHHRVSLRGQSRR